MIGEPAVLMTERELRLIFSNRSGRACNVGVLQQDQAIPAQIDVEQLVSKHFAVLGTTGVGKSNGVALLLQQILQERPELRIFLIDPHNEYARCFGDKAQVLTPRNLRLPFWLFNFEETVDAFFGGRPGVDEEIEILQEAIPIAKAAYSQLKGGTADRGPDEEEGPARCRATASTRRCPTASRISITVIDDRMGKLENRSRAATYNKLLLRIKTFRNHPRYGFMFENATVGGDTMGEVVSHLFRLPANGKPMTIMQLAGFPAEVIDSVVSVLLAHGLRLRPRGATAPRRCCSSARRRIAMRRPTRTSASARPSARCRASPRRPQVRRVPRARDAASGRDRPDHPVPVQHAVRDAAVQRPRPGAHPLGGVGRRRQHAELHSDARHRRGVRVRRGRAAADPDEIPRAAAASAAEQRSRRQCARGGRAGRPRHDRLRDRPLARLDDEPQGRRHRRRPLRRPGGCPTDPVGTTSRAAARKRRSIVLRRRCSPRHLRRPRRKRPWRRWLLLRRLRLRCRRCPLHQHRPPCRRKPPGRTAAEASCASPITGTPGPDNPAPLPSRFRT